MVFLLNKKSETLYQGQDEWINSRTGEKIIADEMVKKVTRQGFMITYLSTIIDMIDDIGNKKMQVVKYILNNMSLADNTLIITTAELIKKTKTSVNTVQNTLKALEKAGIITRRTGALMVSEKLIHRGNHQKQAFLLTRFQAFNGDEKQIEKKEPINVTPKKTKKELKQLPENIEPHPDQISIILDEKQKRCDEDGVIIDNENNEKICPHCNEILKLKKDKSEYYCPNFYSKNPQEKCKGHTKKNIYFGDKNPNSIIEQIKKTDLESCKKLLFGYDKKTLIEIAQQVKVSIKNNDSKERIVEKIHFDLVSFGENWDAMTRGVKD